MTIQILMLTRTAIALLIGLAVSFASTASGADREAASRVKQGIQHHARGDYEAAAAAFGRAAELLPDDPRVTFDRACALAAQGKTAEAEELFRAATLVREQETAAASHYNLGRLASQEAKTAFGEQPEVAVPEKREEGLRLLQRAIGDYRNCLRIDPDHAAARHNLELLRLWIKHMQDVWAQRDREQRREQMDLLAFLDWLQREQRTLRAAAKTLEQLADSARRRQAVGKLESAQRDLADEIEPLQQKIAETVRTSQTAAADNGQLETVISALHAIAARAENEMSRAAVDLAVGELAKAVNSQTDAVKALNEIYEQVAPFETMLQGAIETQRELVASSNEAIEIHAQQDDAAAIDVQLLAENQEFVAGWAEMLGLKAEHLLSQPSPATDSAEPERQEAQAALRAAYEKAVEHAPRIRQLAGGAALHVADHQWNNALPQQEEALKLLKEIAEQLPQQPLQDDKQQQDQQDQQQQNQDQQQNEQQPQDQQPDDQKKSPDKADDKNQKEQPQQQQQLSRQQAEALLDKVRERERQQREREKQIQALLRAGITVDKDW